MDWKITEFESPSEGTEVIGFSPGWIDEDFNPNGTRVCFLGGDGWISAYWCNYHDEYHTRDSVEDNEQFADSKAENQIPTHWMPIPETLNIEL